MIKSEIEICIVLARKNQGYGFSIDLKLFPIDLTSNRYNRRYSLSCGGIFNPISGGVENIH